MATNWEKMCDHSMKINLILAKENSALKVKLAKAKTTIKDLKKRKH